MFHDKVFRDILYFVKYRNIEFLPLMSSNAYSAFDIQCAAMLTNTQYLLFAVKYCGSNSNPPIITKHIPPNPLEMHIDITPYASPDSSITKQCYFFGLRNGCASVLKTKSSRLTMLGSLKIR